MECTAKTVPDPTFKMNRRIHIPTRRFLVYSAIMIFLSSCGYLQVNPPPDVRASDDPEDHSAWLAAASNMLAAAGYGYGQDVQVRADRIYRQMTDHYGTTEEGWTDAALQWWLESAHNEWPENPYKAVMVIGNKQPPQPWADPGGATLIGNLLREGHIVSASLSWPDPENPGQGTGGHVLNCWGDDRGEKKSQAPPEHLRVTDCHRNRGGIIQTYSYGAFIKSHPDGTTWKGWSLSYDDHHPYIKHIILLSRVQHPFEGQLAFINRILLPWTNSLSARASMLSLDFLYDGDLFSFQSSLHLPGQQAIKAGNARKETGPLRIFCEWDLGRNDLGRDKTFTLELESLGEWDSWTGSGGGYLAMREEGSRDSIPQFSFRISGSKASERYSGAPATGGYYILSLTFRRSDSLQGGVFEVFETSLMRQYPPGIDPEKPQLQVTAPAGYVLSTVKAGHSYGALDAGAQLEFASWMENLEPAHLFSEDTLTLSLNMLGLLPYPKGENFSKRPGAIQ